ncbi:hypothetical protein BJV78DRAFT_345099 [Lactifluus subvellereus]|nr:hypothetical protein BJV78DRAFT_345099 [Lactifluus subvellereus]
MGLRFHEYDLVMIVFKRSSRCCHPPNTYLSQITFLSEDTFVLMQKEATLSNRAKSLGGTRPVWKHCVLVPPALQQGISCIVVECQGDQIVASQDPFTRSGRLPFVSDPNGAMLCFTLGFRQSVGGFDYLGSFSFWVRRCSLCEYAARGGNQKYSWDAWGPSMTRWTDWGHGLAPCWPGDSRSALFPLLIEVV